MFKLNQKSYIIALFLILTAAKGSATLTAQPLSERFGADVSMFTTVGSEFEQGFWLTHNRFGMFDERNANGVGIISTRLLTRDKKLFDLGGGIDLLGRISEENNFYLHQAYLEAKMGVFSLYAGRKETTLGDTYEELSSGSLGMSRNAVPIPRISFSADEFFDIPFTQGLLQGKGHFAHGWLNDNRYAQGAYFHDKSARLQTGIINNAEIYFGLVHMAIWGGETDSHGELPAGFNDFLRVLVAYEGTDDAPSNEVNALGFHTGVWEHGVRVTWNKTELHFYYHHLFTDGSGQNYKNRGDGLFGIGVRNIPGTEWLSGFLYEFLNSRHQSGPGLSDRRPGVDFPDFCEEENCGYRFGGRDNYYNNSIYRSGLSYYGHSIGSPLFMTQNRLDLHRKGIETYSSQYFVSNRNLAHHMGFKGWVSPTLSYKLLATYVRYYGTYRGLNLGTYWGSLDPEMNQEEYFFNPPQNQWYLMLETQWRIAHDSNIALITTLTTDRGDLFNNTGFMAGLRWSLEN